MATLRAAAKGGPARARRTSAAPARHRRSSLRTRSLHDLAGGSSLLLNAFSCILSVMEGATLRNQSGGREHDGFEQEGLVAGVFEPDGREHGAMTYWRRRFIALTVGLGILSLIAWAFSGTLGTSQAGGSTAARDARASHGHSARTAAGSGGAGGGFRAAHEPQ